ncbi:MAG TPA: hypothetical protein VFO19_06605 [Vicinamibacterales bacterium]|nr:hypothetical protein [Vicinamibacterales bacterium]
MTNASGPKDADQFVVAVKRDARATAPADWIEQVRRTPGVTVLGAANPNRVQIRATADAIRHLRETLADCLHVEPIVRHERS